MKIELIEVQPTYQITLTGGQLAALMDALDDLDDYSGLQDPVMELFKEIKNVLR